MVLEHQGLRLTGRGRATENGLAKEKGLVSLYQNPFVHWIPNGVDFDLFRVEDATDQFERDRTIVGYVGTIQERLDLKLIEFLCKEHPDKNFWFIGPIWAGIRNDIEKIDENYKNIEFLGRKPYTEIPELLTKIDITIIPHKLDKFLESTNPMKMYDYLAAGKPIVTTPGAGTEMFSDIISICKTKEEFSKAIDQEIRMNTAGKIETRKNAVKMHIWENRVEKMMDFLKQ